MSGARRRNSSIEPTGGGHTPVRIRLIGGPIIRSADPTPTVRAAASRIRPTAPPNGLRPSPNGGSPAALSGGVYGEKHAHGMDPASAADRAPQQFTSTSNAS